MKNDDDKLSDGYKVWHFVCHRLRTREASFKVTQTRHAFSVKNSSSFFRFIDFLQCCFLFAHLKHHLERKNPISSFWRQIEHFRDVLVHCQMTKTTTVKSYRKIDSGNIWNSFFFRCFGGGKLKFRWCLQKKKMLKSEKKINSEHKNVLLDESPRDIIKSPSRQHLAKVITSQHFSSFSHTQIMNYCRATSVKMLQSQQTSNVWRLLIPKNDILRLFLSHISSLTSCRHNRNSTRVAKALQHRIANKCNQHIFSLSFH